MTRSPSVFLMAALALAALVVPSAPPVGAEAALAVSSATLSPDGPSTITVNGRGYLVPPHVAGSSVFGGVYVFFGWVRPGAGWGPSSRNAVNSDGQFGITYHYPGEGGTGDLRDDGSGANRFVAFTPGGIDAGSTPFHMDDAGNWSVALNIAGPVYRWSDPFTGAAASVDCRSVQCGVFTLGAHGRPSRTNERFVPISFAAPSVAPAPTAAPVPSAAAPSVNVGGITTVPARPGSTTPRPATSGAAAPTKAPATETVPPVAEATTTTVPATGAEPAASTSAPGRSGDDQRVRASGSAVPDQGVVRIEAADDGSFGAVVPFFVAGAGIPAAAGLVLVIRARRAAPPS